MSSDPSTGSSNFSISVTGNLFAAGSLFQSTGNFTLRVKTSEFRDTMPAGYSSLSGT
jgi:hypothetical protein